MDASNTSPTCLKREGDAHSGALVIDASPDCACAGGKGAIATIFAVVDVAMLRPLPYDQPESLVFGTGTEPTGPGSTVNMSLGYVQFARWRSDNQAFAALEGYSPVTMKFLGGAAPEPVQGALVSAGFFDVLGFKPESGRVFTPAEELPRSGVVVISHGLWQRRFGSDPSIVGKVINIDEESREIVGVMPASFPMVSQTADAWLPLPLDPKQQTLKARLILAIGRLRPGMTPQQAASDLDRINKALGSERPDEYLAGSAAKGLGNRHERRRREGLLVAQVGLAVVLLIGAALLARNIRALLEQPTGFETDGVSVVELTFSPSTYTTTQARAQHAGRLLDAVRAVPGVSAAATIQTRFVLNETMQTLFEIEGRPTPSAAQRFVSIRHVTPQVGQVLGVRLIRGRMFADTGRRIRRVVSQAAPWMEIVGVVDDLKDSGVGVDMGPQLFVSYLQQNTASARPTVVVRSALGAETLFPALRRAIWSVDGNQTIDSISRLEQLMVRSAAQPRFAALVSGLLASCAMILVLSGIYSVTLYGVLRRTREIGLRLALGARPTELLWTVVRQSLIPTALGVGVGVMACVPAVGWMRPLLAHGMSFQDVPTLFAALISTIGASLIAALIPARRALAVPPSIAMRDVG